MLIQTALHTTLVEGSADWELSFTPKLQAPIGECFWSWLLQNLIWDLIFFFFLLATLGRCG